MNLILSGRGVDLDQSLRDYATEKFTRVQRFFDRIIKMEVELRHERNPRVKDPDRVDVTVSTPRETLRVHGEGIDHRAAIDMAVDRLEIQIKKHKERLIARNHRDNHKVVPAPSDSIGDLGVDLLGEDTDESAEAQIVRITPPIAKPLMPEEAKIELDDRGLEFLMFLNAESMRPAVLYRRAAGDYGLIEHR